MTNDIAHRIHSCFVTAAALLAVGGGLTGCGAAADGTRADDNVEEASAAAVSPITSNGTIGGGPGTVQIEYIDSAGISGCSGVAIGPNAVLTAGHCFDAGLGNNVWGYVDLKIHYSWDGTTFHCISSPYESAGRCLTWEKIWVDRLAPRAARGQAVDATVDFALLTTTRSFVNIDWFPDLFTYQRVGDGVRDFGTGYEPYPYTMRYFDDRLDSVGSDYMLIDAGSTRVCHGDSGGALMRMNWYGYDLVTGVLTNHQGTGEEPCATKGAAQRYHRITNARVDWINSKTNWVRDYGQPACYPFATINNHNAAFRCF